MLFDVFVLVLVVVAAWLLIGNFRPWFTLAEMFGLTTSVAATLSFHVCAWGRYFKLSQFAVDVGVFSLVVLALRIVQICTTQDGLTLTGMINPRVLTGPRTARTLLGGPPARDHCPDCSSARMSPQQGRSA